MAATQAADAADLVATWPPLSPGQLARLAAIIGDDASAAPAA